MRELIKAVDKTNKVMAEAFAEDFQPVVFRASPPKSRSDPIMLDGKTRRALSPQGIELFSHIAVWPSAFGGKTIIAPPHQEALISIEAVSEEIRLTKLNFSPFPPAVSGDDARTMIFAHEPFEHWLAYLWWETEASKRPVHLAWYPVVHSFR